MHSPTVGSQVGTVSCERGTPVLFCNISSSDLSGVSQPVLSAATQGTSGGYFNGQHPKIFQESRALVRQIMTKEPVSLRMLVYLVIYDSG